MSKAYLMKMDGWKDRQKDNEQNDGKIIDRTHNQDSKVKKDLSADRHIIIKLPEELFVPVVLVPQEQSGCWEEFRKGIELHLPNP